MKNTRRWLGISLPWIAGIGLLSVFCVQAYLHGKTFAQQVHSFRWLVNMFIGAVVYLPALLIATIITFLSRRQLKRCRTLARAIVIVGTSLIVPFLAMPGMSWCFFAGRDAAYRSVNYQGIYDACMGLRNRVLDSGTDFMFRKGPDSEDCLPPAIRRLSPLRVYATANAVAIQMDGGGIMYHEGIGVVLRGRSLPQEGIRPLHDSLPVYLYRLYDFRIFLDSIEEGEPGAAPDRAERGR